MAVRLLWRWRACVAATRSAPNSRRRPTRSRSWCARLETGARDRRPRGAAGADGQGCRRDLTLDEFAEAAGAKPTRVVIKERDRLRARGQSPASSDRSLRRARHRGAARHLARRPAPPVRQSADRDDWRIERDGAVSNVAGLLPPRARPRRASSTSATSSSRAPMSTIEMSGRHRVRRRDPPTARRRSCCSDAAACSFAPPIPAERTQIRIFTGADDLQSEFDAAFIRAAPVDFEASSAPNRSCRAAASRPTLRRATEVFDEYVGQDASDRSDRSEPRPLVARARRPAI